MTQPRFIQIHSLASYPGTLLNRDDAGLAKRLPFGGAVRARVSSQALKRRWRFAGTADHEAAKAVPDSLQSLGLPMGDRSKEVVERLVMPQALQKVPGLHPDAQKVIAEKLIVELYGDKAADPKARQALFFGHPEISYLQTLAGDLLAQAAQQPALQAAATKAPDKQALKALDEMLKATLAPLRKNLRVLAENGSHAAGLESALFGRMVTSDPAANVDAPVHVAHAFTVHGIERELDYVTAVDDLRQRSDDGETGSAGIFDIELTSGLFYSYVVIDVTLLTSNLNGDAALAGRVAERLLKLIARTSPGAKKGSTAPYAHAEFMLVEAGDEQPRTLANAFRAPVPLRGDIFAGAMTALLSHLANLDQAYGATGRRWQLSVTPPALPDVSKASLVELGQALRGCISGEAD